MPKGYNNANLPLRSLVVSHFLGAKKLANDGDYTDKSKHVGAERLSLSQLLQAYSAGRPLAEGSAAMAAAAQRSTSIPNMVSLIDKQNLRMAKGFRKQQKRMEKKRIAQNKALDKDYERVQRRLRKSKGTSTTPTRPPRPTTSGPDFKEIDFVSPLAGIAQTKPTVGTSMGVGLGFSGIRPPLEKTNSYKGFPAFVAEFSATTVKQANTPAAVLMDSSNRGDSPRLLSMLPLVGGLLGAGLSVKNPAIAKYLAPAGGPTALKALLGGATGATLGWLPEVSYNAVNAFSGESR